jgi:Asp-tRNA(Asn)/Glu-tRNA(Gln) amidotransferase A subunit family amidase
VKDLTKLTATDAAGLIARKEISSVELTKACLGLIRERNGDVGAWRHINEEFSLAQAAEADKTPARTPLHGIPFGVKDVIDTKDFPTEYGSRVHVGRSPKADALCVSRMREAGAVLLGKLVTTEYALFTPNETRHPMNLAHTAGGSSSGTGAAVADMHVPIAFGNQTAGSLIRPASFCGVFGFKPTHGLVEGTGILPLQPFFDTLGYMARSVDDLQSFFSIASRSNQLMQWDRRRTPKIALCKTYQWNEAQPETRYVLEQTAKQLAAQGIEVTEVELPSKFADLVAAHHTVLWKGISESLEADYNAAKDKMSPRLVSIIEEGFKTPQEEYAKQRKFAEECRNSVNDIFGDFDAIICPSAPGEAPAGMGTGDPIFQVVWTLLGVPVLNLPVGTGPNRLPVGVQLVCRRNDDAKILALGKYLMQRLSQVQMASTIGIHA